MLDSAFTFYRGAAAIMAADLNETPNSGLEVQLCGDAHLSNFGVFQAPDRKLVFDINDFDETLPGPFEWDVKRLVASLAVGGRDRGFDERERRRVILEGARSYREAMHGFAAMREIDIWYSRLEVDDLLRALQPKLTSQELKRLEKGRKKALHKDSLRALSRLTDSADGRLRIASRPPILVPAREIAASRVAGGLSEEEISAFMEGLIGDYINTLDSHNRRLAERYHYVDSGRKVVGVGSVGTRAWIVMLFGRDAEDPLFLQAKEAGPSVLEPFAGASRFRHHGHRVVAGQRLMQATGDLLLGWLTAEDLDGTELDFYVRQLWDGKASAEIDLMDPTRMGAYAGLCGWTLARAHARSGDPIAIAAYLGKGKAFDEAVTDFAEAYADQNESDYQELIEAEKSGDLATQRGV
jgi:uncharacterized protein (DUF2252 family)